MDDCHSAPDAEPLRRLTPRDEIGINLHVRSYRSAWLRARAQALLLLVRRHGESRLSRLSRRRRKIAAKGYALTTAMQVLITNLSAMR